MPRKKTVAAKADTRKTAATPVADTPAGHGRRRLTQILAGLALAAVFLGTLIAVGQWSLEQLRGQERYLTRFSDIDCVPPPGMPRSAFLDEVQYLSRLSDRLSVLEENLSQKLTAAFAKHPWVEKVVGVKVEPPRAVRVRLVMRRPILAVRTPEGLIAVDRHGVRLPKNAVTADLPILEGNPRQPGPAGTKWGDPKVEQRAAAVSLGDMP